MPCPRDGVRQIAVQRKAVESFAFNPVVRGQHAHQNLHAPQQNHHKEILQRGSLARRRLHRQEWIILRIRPANQDLFL